MAKVIAIYKIDIDRMTSKDLINQLKSFGWDILKHANDACWQFDESKSHCQIGDTMYGWRWNSGSSSSSSRVSSSWAEIANACIPYMRLIGSIDNYRVPGRLINTSLRAPEGHTASVSNNDSRTTCYACGEPTRPCGGFFVGPGHNYRICTKCGK